MNRIIHKMNQETCSETRPMMKKKKKLLGLKMRNKRKNLRKIKGWKNVGKENLKNKKFLN
jgi:hypothetical protein